uniref:THAP-type domain-containing protein n=1 Tax=Phlebotomus kandelakii TaxID=1109342 RepID=A0A6B2EIR2_9DIPT
MTRCSFEGCDNLYLPCSRLTFFNLPKDPTRRDVWVANSGNRRLMWEYLKNKNVRRLFCENHFRKQHKKCQFNRTTLHREAIPDPYDKDLAEAFIRKGEEGVLLWEEENAKEEVPVAIVAPRNHEEDENLIEIQQLDDLTEHGEDTEYEVLEDEDTVAMQTVNKLIRTYTARKGRQKHPTEQIETPPDMSPEWEASQEADVVFEFTTASQQQTSSVQEEDRCFVLSLLEPLRKLTPEQRAVAKVNILKYLLELEVGKKTATL